MSLHVEQQLCEPYIKEYSSDHVKYAGLVSGARLRRTSILADSRCSMCLLDTLHAHPSHRT